MDPATRAQKQLEVIEQQIAQLQERAAKDQTAHHQIRRLHEQVQLLREQVGSYTSAWRKAMLARHSQRPFMLDYVERLFNDWSEVHGDRYFGDDPAVLCGMARYHGEEVMVIGHQKGRDTKQRI